MRIRWLLAAIALVVVAGSASTIAYEHRPAGGSSAGQCAKPIDQRTGGWTC